MSTDIIKEATEFEQKRLVFKTKDDRINASRQLKEYVLALNELYKESKDSDIMDLMKKLTVKKKKVDVRLKGRLTA